ncbi:SAM-dependent chlorinase/fluorinase [Flavobacterium sp. NRK F10]|uniref:SAM hydrolase/SAM-dependent halogenase family protein n=1 Tax=Flavobacterium sp. NRK F10 TaxID=2954931 RepID=UPI002090B2BB|nr:SAM-dependent chlorinase/fluorinase [Flavobacterium sp. NRK F10]MCO6175988.1 SAM-dependent chlorinase/fluorinase [Flavobacterium sp. NRK F10]
MSIITLTTDFGLKDHFVGATKGKIISGYEEAVIVDISHDIDLFNTTEAGYCIAAAYSSFPKGTIHIIGVDSERNDTIQHIAMQWDDHYFICADNGILSTLTQRKIPQKIVAINIHNRLQENATDMDVFTTVACHIARGGHLNVIGKEIETLKTVNELVPKITNEQSVIKGNVIYIDHFGNCITNISKKLFQEMARGRSFEISFHNKKITTIKKSYSDFNTSDKFTLKDFEGERLALFNENGLLEIAIYKSNPKTVGSAHSLLGLKFRDVVTITFS